MEQNSPPLEVLVHESTQDLVGDARRVRGHRAGQPEGLRRAVQRVPARRPSTTAPREAEAIVPEVSAGHAHLPELRRADARTGCASATSAARRSSASVARESRRTVTIVFAMPKVHSLTRRGARARRRCATSCRATSRACATPSSGTAGRSRSSSATRSWRSSGCRSGTRTTRSAAIRAAADMQAALDALNPGFRTRLRARAQQPHRRQQRRGHRRRREHGPADGHRRRGEHGGAARAGRRQRRGRPRRPDLPARARPDRGRVHGAARRSRARPSRCPPIASSRVRRAAAAAERSHGTPFVGREAEMGRLSGGARRTRSTNRGARLVTVVGDAGVGKSRLIREFAAAPREQATARPRALPAVRRRHHVLAARRGRPRGGGHHQRGHAARSRRGASTGCWSSAGAEDREAIVERVAAAINLSAAQFPVAELMWGGRRFLETLAAERPVVMLVDDLHWAEATFLDFLDHLLETVEDASILVLGSARHEIAERHAEWSTAHEAMLIMLQPLSEADAGQIVEELLGSLEPSVRARIARGRRGQPAVRRADRLDARRDRGDRARHRRLGRPRRRRRSSRSRRRSRRWSPSRLDALKTRGARGRRPGLGDRPVVPDGRGRRARRRAGPAAPRRRPRRPRREAARPPPGRGRRRSTASATRSSATRPTAACSSAPAPALHERFVTWAERVNRERGRELEFEEILGYHLEQAYQLPDRPRRRSTPRRVDVGERAAEKLSSAGRRALGRGDIPAAASLLRAPSTCCRELDRSGSSSSSTSPRRSSSRARSTRPRACSTERGRGGEAIGDERLEARVRLLERQVGRCSSAAPGRRGRAARGGRSGRRRSSRRRRRRRARAGLARLEMHARGHAGPVRRRAAAAEQIVDHARRAGDERLVSRSVARRSRTSCVHGPDAGRRAPSPQCEDARRASQRRPEDRGDRSLGALAQLLAMDGEFDEARDLYRRGQDDPRRARRRHRRALHVDRLRAASSCSPATSTPRSASCGATTTRSWRSARPTSGRRSPACSARSCWRAGRPRGGGSQFAEIAEEIADERRLRARRCCGGSPRARVLAARGDDRRGAGARARRRSSSRRDTEEVGPPGRRARRARPGASARAATPKKRRAALAGGPGAVEAKGDRASPPRRIGELVARAGLGSPGYQVAAERCRCGAATRRSCSSCRSS